ncbi:MAG: tRNA preQ1(34) S-adenosylmethionine ribosyltransferase-isomerase QueA [bacterium]
MNESLKTSEFDFDLPPELIAQTPREDREAARMMVVDRASGTLQHHTVRDLPAFLRADDLLVLNDTRVIPARIYGRKEGTGGRVELLLLEDLNDGRWHALCGSSRRPHVGTRLIMADGRLTAEVAEWGEGGGILVRFHADRPVLEVLEEVGIPPLPPYIKRDKVPEPDTLARDRVFYQTVYARVPGAVAAPTAGLHITDSLLQRLKDKGVSHTAVTLHVGMGTFKPVKTERVADHQMESERFDVTPETVELIMQAKTRKGRVVATGSTVVRTLETVATEDGTMIPSSGRTRIFITPPYRFKVVDAMLTNFHLPKSTLIMMVSALAGTELIRHAYAEAIREGYRFYSYGDSMLIL